MKINKDLSLKQCNLAKLHLLRDVLSICKLFSYSCASHNGQPLYETKNSLFCITAVSQIGHVSHNGGFRCYVKHLYVSHTGHFVCNMRHLYKCRTKRLFVYLTYRLNVWPVCKFVSQTGGRYERYHSITIT